MRTFGGEEKFFWHQLSLSLICDQRFSRATKVLQNCISLTETTPSKADESLVMEHMHLARMQIELLDDMDLGERI
jgi:hypothetical protein